MPDYLNMTDTETSVYAYDAERDADIAVEAYLQNHEPYDKNTGVTDREMEKFIGWWWPKERIPLTASKL